MVIITEVVVELVLSVVVVDTDVVNIIVVLFVVDNVVSIEFVEIFTAFMLVATPEKVTIKNIILLHPIKKKNLISECLYHTIITREDFLVVNSLDVD
jgi:hypothetical protein